MAVLNALVTKLLKFAKGTSGQDAVRRTTREENISRALGKVEPYVVWLQSILIWENPFQTIVAYICFNVLFWLIVSLDFRFYFLLFFATLVVLVYEMWVDKVWPEIRVALPAEQGDKEDWTPLHPSVLSAPELGHYLNRMMQLLHNLYMWLLSLRINQPGMFCALLSIGCLVLMLIGKSVSGTTLLYLIFMSLLLIPGICIHVLPAVSQLDWQGQLEKIRPKENESDVDEYLPEQSGSNMVFLERAVEPDHSDHDDDDDFNIPPTELLHMDDMTDSGAPSLTFISGITAMPAHEDSSLDSSDFALDVSKSIASKSNSNKQTLDLDVNISDSDESISLPEREAAGIHFKNRHFNGDSSSEEENGPLRRNEMKNSVKTDQKGSTGGAVADAAAAVLSYSSVGAMNLASLGASVGQSLISSVISGSSSVPTSRSAPVKEDIDEDDSLSDTEGFEMISEEEFASL